MKLKSLEIKMNIRHLRNSKSCHFYVKSPQESKREKHVLT